MTGCVKIIAEGEINHNGEVDLIKFPEIRTEPPTNLHGDQKTVGDANDCWQNLSLLLTETVRQLSH